MNTKKLALRKLIIVYILSGGLYMFYWFYKNWLDFNQTHTMNIRPLWRTIGLIIPIWNVYLLFTHFQMVSDYLQKEGIRTHLRAGISTILLVQERLNDYWTVMEKSTESKNDSTLNTLDMLIIISGIIIYVVYSLYSF